MPLYTVDDKNNLLECEWNCSNKEHEHFQGSFQNAIRHFKVDTNTIKSYGDVFNIIVYLQTDRNTTRRFSNELYDRAIENLSKKKYFVPTEKREEVAIAALNKAYDFNLIMDDILYDRLKDSERPADKTRIYFYEKFKKDETYRDLGLKY